MFDKTLEIIAPHTCCGCGQVGSLLCEHCINDIISEPYTFCITCLKPVAIDNLCRNCHKDTSWENAWVVGARKDAVKRLIDLYKFEHAMAADITLANLLSLRLPYLPSDTIVTYIPATATHTRQRGYSTMERVATKLAQVRGLSVGKIIERKKDIVQRGAGRALRLQQQYEALAVRKTDHKGPILLIDDVCTTGGTLRAATQRLKEFYNQPIYVAVIARQPLDDLSDL